ncbi:hypothetical protein ABIE51_001402 [Lysobacter sp. OAE881]
MTNWQPIETAPKDGRWFIAYNPMTGPYGTCYREGQFPFYGWAPQTHGCGIWYPTPTHWQPFPEAPDVGR